MTTYYSSQRTLCDFFLFTADAKVQGQEVVPVLIAGQSAEPALGLLGTLCRDRDFHSTNESNLKRDSRVTLSLIASGLAVCTALSHC